MKSLLTLLLLAALVPLTSCQREPELHLYEGATVEMDLPAIDLSLAVLWDYELIYGVVYDWRAEWHYGWDEEDEAIFGPVGYREPSVFHLRRYFTGQAPLQPHQYVLRETIAGTSFRGNYAWGYWDMLVWNDAESLDGVQSLHFDETESLDRVTAYTNQSMQVARYQSPRYTHSFYEPEPLFAAYEQGIDISPDLNGFEYDPERGVYVKTLNMQLEPVTYIYLTQVILHHNRGRITAIDGSADLSGMARSTTLNDGRAGSDAITVWYKARLKRDCDMAGEKVDIVGGRLLTFGICDLSANTVRRPEDVTDLNHHYMDVTMQFNNGMDSTFVFDVSDQVRRRYKGGVITVELDMDTVPLPRRSGGSAFDAVVEDFVEETHEFEM